MSERGDHRCTACGCDFCDHGHPLAGGGCGSCGDCDGWTWA